MQLQSSEKIFHIYSSSAGSGKTYRLVLEYLKLALQSPVAFQQILAITFTNKATREMKERIVHELTALANGHKSAMKEELCSFFQFDENELSQKAHLLIRHILHNYSALYISTIDSFFQSIIKSFARDLGMLGNYKVEMDQDKVISEITDRLLDELGGNAKITQWIVDYAHSQLDDNKSWDVRKNIKSLSEELFKEEFQRNAEILNDLNQKPDFFTDFQKKLQKIRKDFEQNMKSLGQEGLNLMQKYDLTPDDFAYGKSGVGGYFDKLVSRKEYEYGKRVKDASENEEAWYTKSSSRKKDIIQCVNGGLKDLLSSILTHYDGEGIIYNTAIQVEKNLYVFGLLSDLQSKITQYRYEHDTMLISDNGMFLRGITHENDAPFIYEKTGTRFSNFLIDEFQDTSTFQWDNLKPLLINGLSESNLSLIVGDVKQSIYRWRSGNWELLAGKIYQDIDEDISQPHQLSINWRSHRNIIDFNNAVFNKAPEILEEKSELEGEKLNEGTETTLLNFEELYKDAVQQISPSKAEETVGAGYVEIRLYPNEKDTSPPWKERLTTDLPRYIEELQRIGVPAHDIAILVRKRSEGDEVVKQMMEWKTGPHAKAGIVYDVISPESLRLDAAPAVRLLLSALKVLLNEKEELAIAELVTEYLYICDPEGNTLNTSLTKPGEALLELLPAEFIENRGNLQQKPLLQLTESLIRLFKLNELQGAQPFLIAFQDAVLDFLNEFYSDINRFLRWWNENGYKRALQIPESANAMRVMTIHKSKGLQFKAVILPWCNWPLEPDSKNQKIIWRASEAEPFDQAGIIPLKFGSGLRNTLFQNDYFLEFQREMVDSLNLLYVALTRAEEFLIILAPDKPKSQKLMVKDISCMLHAVDDNIIQIPGLKRMEGNDCKQFTLGNFVYSQGDEKSGSHTKDMPLLKYLGSEWNRKLVIARRKNPANQKQVSYGVLMHRILSEIEYQPHASQAIRNLIREGIIDQQNAEILEQKISALFADPQIRQWFSEEWIVKNEHTLLIPNEMSRRPDRVLLKGSEAIVIDFKTGKKQDSYLKQVQRYKQVLSDMGYRQVSAFLLYLQEDEKPEIVEVQ
ncbi:MAG: UvrD-helicase domain-containing protein [Cyclobacteriaceae bacterium]|nr:UvrD-helicase domain-containing protein [Cyclobacteriaceae bacterium]